MVIKFPRVNTDEFDSRLLRLFMSRHQFENLFLASTRSFIKCHSSLERIKVRDQTRPCSFSIFDCSASRIPDRSEIDIDLIFGTTADKSYHDLVIQNGKTSPIMNSTSPQSKGFGSSYMTNTGLRGINYTV